MSATLLRMQRPSGQAARWYAAHTHRHGRTSSMSMHRNRNRWYAGSPSLRKDEYPEHTLFPMPALSPTMETGSISSWNLQEGDEFAAGDIVCAIETDKATVDFESTDDGILAKILKSGDDAQNLPVGVPICVVVEDREDVQAFANYTHPAEEVKEEPVVAASAVAADVAADVAPVRVVSPQFVLMPSARHISQSKGVDATNLPGTGKGGRVTKGDVLQALANGTPMPSLNATTSTTTTTAPTNPAPAVASTTKTAIPVVIPEIQTKDGAYEDVANNNMRKIIAKRLTESKRDVSHFYTSIEVELDNVMALRKQLVKNHEVKVSVNDLIIRSSALALRDVPEVNATYNATTKTIQMQPTVDISVAVATPTGLITPIVPNTDTLGLSQITNKVRDLAGRAREGKLQPHEYQGGTFTISNLGMFGIDEFSAVINPPQAAILAVGGGSKRIVPTVYDPSKSKEEQDKPKVKIIMTARLSADRRVVDEATAALFLAAFQRYLGQPELLLL